MLASFTLACVLSMLFIPESEIKKFELCETELFFCACPFGVDVQQAISTNTALCQLPKSSSELFRNNECRVFVTIAYGEQYLREVLREEFYGAQAKVTEILKKLLECRVLAFCKSPKARPGHYR